MKVLQYYIAVSDSYDVFHDPWSIGGNVVMASPEGSAFIGSNYDSLGRYWSGADLVRK